MFESIRRMGQIKDTDSYNNRICSWFITGTYIELHTDNCCLQTDNCYLQTDNFCLQTDNCYLQTDNCCLQTDNFCLQTDNCCLKTVNCCLQTVNFYIIGTVSAGKAKARMLKSSNTHQCPIL